MAGRPSLSDAAIVRTSDEARALLAESVADDVGAIGAYIAPVEINEHRRDQARQSARTHPLAKASPSIFRFRRKAHLAMYAYDELDRTLINERVSEFRDQVKRRLSGELTEDQFKLLRLKNGVYLQLHAYMLRVAIPYGTLSSKQLRRLAHVARTLRSRLRPFHHPAEHPVQLDQAGRTAGCAGRSRRGRHARDPDLRQLHPQRHRRPVGRRRAGRDRGSAHLGRTAAPVDRRCIRNSRSCRASSRSRSPRPTHDRAAIKVHDIGLRLHKNAEGETGFEVLVGGGLGRTPFIGKTIKPFVPGRDLLSYVEAILRVYNQYGRRDNIYKARIKILVHELGIEKFAQRGRGRVAADRATAR